MLIKIQLFKIKTQNIITTSFTQITRAITSNCEFILCCITIVYCAISMSSLCYDFSWALLNMEKHTMADIPELNVLKLATMALDEKTEDTYGINALTHLIKTIQIDDKNPDKITELKNNKNHSEATRKLFNDKTVKLDGERKICTELRLMKLTSKQGREVHKKDLPVGNHKGRVVKLIPHCPGNGNSEPTEHGMKDKDNNNPAKYRRPVRDDSSESDFSGGCMTVTGGAVENSNTQLVDSLDWLNSLTADSPDSGFGNSPSPPHYSTASPLPNNDIYQLLQEPISSELPKYLLECVVNDPVVIETLSRFPISNEEMIRLCSSNADEYTTPSRLQNSQHGETGAIFTTEDSYSAPNTGLDISPSLQLHVLNAQETFQESTSGGRISDLDDVALWVTPDGSPQSTLIATNVRKPPDMMPSTGSINYCTLDLVTHLQPQASPSANMRLENIICMPNLCLPMTNEQKFCSTLSEREKSELTKLENAINSQSLDKITAVSEEDGDNMLHNYIIYSPEVEQENCLPRWKSKLGIYCLLRRLREHDLLGRFINMRTKRGQTPLYMAVCENFPEAVDLLLSYGANPNLRGRGKEGNHDGPVPLHKAVERGDRGLDCLKLLLSHKGCDVNMEDNDGLTPLMRACLKHNALFDDPTKTKCKQVINSIQSVQLFLINKDVNPFLEAAKCGRTALHFAVQSKDPKLVEVFGPHARREHPEMLTVCGTRLDLINVVNFDKDNVLHTIAGLSMIDKKKQIEIGELLLSFGANVAAMNSSNKRPREVAKASKNLELAELFKMPKNRQSSRSRSSTSTSSNSSVMSTQYDYSSSWSVSHGVSTESSTNYFGFGSALSGPIDTNTTFVFGSSPLLNVHDSSPSSQHGSPYSYQSTVASQPSPEGYQFSPISEHSHSQQDDEDFIFGAAITRHEV